MGLKPQIFKYVKGLILFFGLHLEINLWGWKGLGTKFLLISS